MLILPEVKITNDWYHTELVGPIENAGQAIQVAGPERPISGEGGVVPGLILRIALRTPALKVDRKSQEAVPTPVGHRREKLASVPLGIPTPSVGIRPAFARLRIEIVEDALHEARVHEQPFNPAVSPGAPFIGWPPIDQETFPVDRDAGTSCRKRLERAGCQRCARQGSNTPKEGSSIHVVHPGVQRSNVRPLSRERRLPSLESASTSPRRSSAAAVRWTARIHEIRPTRQSFKEGQIQIKPFKYTKDATMAPNIGTRNAAHSSHRLTVAGRIRSTTALIAAATNRAHPINVLAGYQIAEFDCVEAVLKP